MSGGGDIDNPTAEGKTEVEVEVEYKVGSKWLVS